MMSAFLVLLLYFGFALLALSQHRHRQSVGAPAPSSRGAMVGLRIGGYALITLGLPLAIAEQGPAFGALLWSVLISVAALAVTATLSWRPQWLRPLTRLG